MDLLSSLGLGTSAPAPAMNNSTPVIGQQSLMDDFGLGGLTTAPTTNGEGM